MNFTFAVGDIHGCLEPLREMLDRIGGRAHGGTVVFLGDYVDRGPDSKGVVDLLMSGPGSGSWRWICLMGNHEDMMLRAYGSDEEYIWWLENGGFQTELSYGGRVAFGHLVWAGKLPLMHVDDHRIFVHAGVVPERALNMQRPDDLLWLRVPDDYSTDYWGKHLCHGHTPSDRNPITVANRTNVDSGCVFGGTLSCAVFDDSLAGGPIEFIQVPA
ncbi:serine/threonine protein phosphatase [Rhizobium sp. P32RR-XVIII]|uniref:metallophosphoesterase family protein n=1 Tax=Rhizobium sp. P32RR-XVIII TaxID=2726738 RepID=UPI0014565B76|nr:metallophosphoesterase family protein [Rhizobium sp. P32RR-XVIII]NLS06820.1 serine/threonine protein phosphatase [Rhizobium sp. P32RR-XVIII]